MRCPFCSSENTQVKDSRPTEEHNAIRRRRLCGACGGRFTTFERVQLRELMITKSSGRKAPFDREKLIKSINIATRKRDVDQEKIEQMVTGLARRLEQMGDTEITSTMIGELVMRGLKELDHVAFVRYASVYQNFTEAEDFEEFLRKMKDEDRISG